MNLILKIILTLFLTIEVFAREDGETEITTEDGIEVFQNEKFYLLKKNVKIESDDFSLNANEVKINFDKSLYDIVELNAEGQVNFDSPNYKLIGSGENLNLLVKIEKLKVYGFDSFSGFPPIFHQKDDFKNFKYLFENSKISEQHYQSHLKNSY